MHETFLIIELVCEYFKKYSFQWPWWFNRWSVVNCFKLRIWFSQCNVISKKFALKLKLNVFSYRNIFSLSQLKQHYNLPCLKLFINPFPVFLSNSFHSLISRFTFSSPSCPVLCAVGEEEIRQEIENLGSDLSYYQSSQFSALLHVLMEHLI